MEKPVISTILRSSMLGKLCFPAALGWAALSAATVPAQGLPAQSPVPELSEKRIERLIELGDRLADQGDYLAALKKYTRAYQGVVSKIRGQDFVQPVQPSLFNRRELGEEMIRLMEQEYTPEELRLMEASYKVWGLIPPGLDATALMTAMLTEEVAGFYDPDNKRMVLIVEEGSVAKPTWLGSLLGAKAAFDKDEQKTTLAHELTHALQDQLYDLNAMEAGIEHDDDMLLAFSALVEGDATLLMFMEAGEMKDIQEMNPETMRATFSIMSWMMPLAGGKTFRSAPPIFRDSLTFPYFQGMLFTLAVASQGNWQQVHKTYLDPPVSTEQILHPDKYLGDRDWPQEVQLPDLGDVLKPAGWRYLGGNCMGELQTAILFKRVFGGQAAAAGWDGDRYHVFESDGGHLGLVYASVWDSPADADEFARVYQAYRGAVSAPPTPDTPTPDTPTPDTPTPDTPTPDTPTPDTPTPDTPAVLASSAQRLVQVEGDKVWIVEGFDSLLTKSLVDRLSQCVYAEKRFPLPKR
jgi:hypothetical protein